MLTVVATWIDKKTFDFIYNSREHFVLTVVPRLIRKRLISFASICIFPTVDAIGWMP